MKSQKMDPQFKLGQPVRYGNAMARIKRFANQQVELLLANGKMGSAKVIELRPFFPSPSDGHRFDTQDLTIGRGLRRLLPKPIVTSDALAAELRNLALDATKDAITLFLMGAGKTLVNTLAIGGEGVLNCAYLDGNLDDLDLAELAYQLVHKDLIPVKCNGRAGHVIIDHIDYLSDNHCSVEVFLIPDQDSLLDVLGSLEDHLIEQHAELKATSQRQCIDWDGDIPF